jgi:hypothetical protein
LPPLRDAVTAWKASALIELQKSLRQDAVSYGLKSQWLYQLAEVV